MSIDVAQVPTGWRVPGAYAQVVAKTSGTTLTAMPLRVLLIGVVGTSGTGKPLTVYPNIGAAQVQALAGAGSATAQMVAAFAADAPYTLADLIMVAAPSGAAAATWTVTPDGTATGSGTVALYVSGLRIAATVTSGMKAADVGAALAAAWTDDLVVSTGVKATADATSGVLTLTSVDKGAWVSDIDVRVSTQYGDGVAGMNLTVAQTAAGAGEVDISGALAAVSNTWYTDIACLPNDGNTLTELATESRRRFGAMAKLDTHVYVGVRATYGEALTLAASLNCEFMSVLPAANARFSPWSAAASLCAVASAALNTDPARQLRTLELTALAGMAPDDADLFDDDMRNVLLSKGMSTFNVTQDGRVVLERVVTTRQTDDEGVPTTAWLDIMVPKTASRVRYEWNTYVTETYPRAKLADDGSVLVNVAGANVVTPSSLLGSWVGQTKLYEAAGWIEDADALGALAVFERDATDRNRVNCQLPIKVIGSLIVLASSIELQV